ncbi:MAG: hypothetical protein ACPGR2_12875 [Psychrobium sp.]
MKNILKILAGFIFLFIAGFGLGTTISAPDYALVYIDERTETYLSPACIPSEQLKLLPEMTKGDIKDLTLAPNEACVDSGGFVQDGRSISGKILETLKIIPPLKSRWNDNGTWNW